MAEQHKPVWFITGCSTGFGRELARELLRRGKRVVVTARDKSKVEDLATDSANSLALALDVTDPAQVRAAVQAAEQKFGAIDVLVNNAGYGYLAAIEEGEDAEIRAMFEVNVFGLADTIRAVLPACAVPDEATSSTSPRWAASSAMRPAAITRRPNLPWKVSPRAWPRKSPRSASRCWRWSLVRSAPTGPAGR